MISEHTLVKLGDCRFDSCVILLFFTTKFKRCGITVIMRACHVREGGSIPLVAANILSAF